MLTYKDHLIELKNRLLKVMIFYCLAFAISYYYKQWLYEILIAPLARIHSDDVQVIHTGITEVFTTYLKIVFYSAWALSIPLVSFQVYQFIAPGLKNYERKIAKNLLYLAPVLFICACLFVYFIAMPNALEFFLSFDKLAKQKLIFQARITEYLDFVLSFMLAFGMAFELPVILVVLFLLKIISLEGMIRNRRIVIVLNFTLAGILTPPDVMSQLFLALPMCVLYEISILVCKNINQYMVIHDRY